MKRTVRVALLVLLVPYVVWILGQDRFHPRSHFAVLVLFSAVVPVACGQFIRGKVGSTIAGLLGSVTVLCLALYIPAKVTGDGESLAWLPIVAAWALVITAPVWVVMSVALGAMKESNQQK